MSKESYVRGFCKAAEAAGVDPRALAKYAADEVVVEGAGIGDIESNMLGSKARGNSKRHSYPVGIPFAYHENGYFPALLRNWRGGIPSWNDAGERDGILDSLEAVAPKRVDLEDWDGRYKKGWKQDIGDGGVIQQGQLDKIRERQASMNASQLAAPRTPTWHKIKSWLERVGAENQLDFIRTNTVHPAGEYPNKRDAEREKALQGVEGIDMNNLKRIESTQASNRQSGRSASMT